MKILGVIPARYASTRFPGKPLVVIDGKTMIRRVYERAVSCPDLQDVVVATDDQTIERHVLGFGGRVMMTSPSHGSGTERCEEVCSILESQGVFYDAVINVQGDEPFIHPEQIRELASAFGEDTQIASLMKKIHTLEELTDRNKVKVVADQGGRALYFSRSSVPFVRGANENEWLNQAEFFKHVGIYGYRPHILHEIVRLSETPLEKAESLEQLRWIEHGYRILMKVTSFESIAIDSPADLLKLTNKD